MIQAFTEPPTEDGYYVVIWISFLMPNKIFSREIKIVDGQWQLRRRLDMGTEDPTAWRGIPNGFPTSMSQKTYLRNDSSS